MMANRKTMSIARPTEVDTPVLISGDRSTVIQDEERSPLSDLNTV
jgi:hypothetical protein